MTIGVRLFAMMRDAAGADVVKIDLPDEATAAHAIEAVVALYPALRPFVGRMAVAVNLEYVPLAHVLRAGDDVALIPPVSGG